MAREFIRLCWTCEEIMAEHYKLTEEHERDQKRSRCQNAGCRASGYFSLFSYDPSRPIRDVEGRA